jgi:putative transposase
MTYTNRKAYAGDLTEAQAALLLPLIPAALTGGRPRRTDILSVINAIFYVLCPGCPWRWLPHDYSPQGTVYDDFRKWKKDGTWLKIHDHLRGWVRAIEPERHPHASAGVLDSQSVKTANMINREVGDDAGKQIKGRKRLALVDLMGLLLTVKGMAASVPEREGAKQLLKNVKQPPQKDPRLIKIFADGGFSGKDLMRLIMDPFGLSIETVWRSQTAKGFEVLPKRWVVERTFGWFNQGATIE